MFFTRNPAQVYQNLFPVKSDLVCASKGNSFSGNFAQASAKIEAIPQQFETRGFKTPKSDSPGLLLLDAFLQPLYMNDEAVSILFCPQAPRGDGHGAYFPKQRVDSLLLGGTAPQTRNSPANLHQEGGITKSACSP